MEKFWFMKTVLKVLSKLLEKQICVSLCSKDLCLSLFDWLVAFTREVAMEYIVVSWDRLFQTNTKIGRVIGYCSSNYGVVRCGGGQSEDWFPRSGGLGTGTGLHGHVRLLWTPKA